MNVLEAQTYTLSTCESSAYDTRLRLFSGSRLEAASIEIANVDDACGLQSRIVMALQPGLYTVVVEGYASNEGRYTLVVTCEGPTQAPPCEDSSSSCNYVANLCRTPNVRNQCPLTCGVCTPAVSTPSPDPNIVEIAVSMPDTFSTLVAAVQAAGLVETLSSAGPFTVFAPTNAAFALLGQDTISSLLADPTRLASILTYHVVAGQALAGDLTNGQVLTTVNGATLTVRINADGVAILNNDGTIAATVAQADVLASNGGIHVIDRVLIPATTAASTSTGPRTTLAPGTCPRNCGTQASGGGTCRANGRCLSCNDNRLLLNGACVNSVSCRARRIQSGSQTGANCRCLDDHCNYCNRVVDGDTCRVVSPPYPH